MSVSELNMRLSTLDAPMPKHANDNHAPHEWEYMDSLTAHRCWEEGCFAAMNSTAIEQNPYDDVVRKRLWRMGFSYVQAGSLYREV